MGYGGHARFCFPQHDTASVEGRGHLQQRPAGFPLYPYPICYWKTQLHIRTVPIRNEALTAEHSRLEREHRTSLASVPYVTSATKGVCGKYNPFHSAPTLPRNFRAHQHPASEMVFWQHNDHFSTHEAFTKPISVRTYSVPRAKAACPSVMTLG